MEDFLAIKSGGYIAISEVVRFYEYMDGWHCELRDGSAVVVFAPTFETLIPNHNAHLVSVLLYVFDDEVCVYEYPIVAWLVDEALLTSWVDVSGSSDSFCFAESRAVLDKQTGVYFSVVDETIWSTLEDFKQNALDKHWRRRTAKEKNLASTNDVLEN